MLQRLLKPIGGNWSIKCDYDIQIARDLLEQSMKKLATRKDYDSTLLFYINRDAPITTIAQAISFNQLKLIPR